FQGVGGEAIRGVGDADVVRGIDGEAFGADGGGDDRDLGGHGFVDLQTGAAADSQGDDGDGGTPKIGTYVGDGAGDLDARVGGGELGDFQRRGAADDGEGGFGARLSNEREDLADEIEDAIDVGEPVHGADEDEVGGKPGGKPRG